MLRRGLLLVVALLAVGGVAWAAGHRGGARAPQIYRGVGGDRTGLRPTGVGLPEIGAAAQVGAADLVPSLRAYHDSGRYAHDLAAVARRAKRALVRAVPRHGVHGTLSCTIHYKRVRVGHRRLYRRVQRCHDVNGKPAIVLDIDETSLSNYAGMAAGGFTTASAAVDVVTGSGTPIGPVRSLYRTARARHVAVFFITGRPPALQSVTEGNLRRAGYDKGWTGLEMRPAGEGTKAFKAGERRAIERRGYDIIVNVGDQESDLDGGHADAAFKLPNPFYFIPD